MEIILCENNLAGFLTAVYHYYHAYKNAAIITSDAARITFLDTVHEVEASPELAVKVKAGIIKKLGTTFYKSISTAYLNCHSDKEQIVFEYLKLALKNGAGVNEMHGLREVMDFNDLLRKVRGETHLLSGFIRLQEMENGVYYGFFSSDHDILELLIPSFVPRFNSQKFALHDIKRKKLAYYDGNECHMLSAPDGVEITLSETESAFRQLWKQYFGTVSIPERENPRLQTKNLPKRYRFFMHEF